MYCILLFYYFNYINLYCFFKDPVLPEKNANQMSTKMFDYFMQCLRTVYYYYAVAGHRSSDADETAASNADDTQNAHPPTDTSTRQSEDGGSSWSHEATDGWPDTPSKEKAEEVLYCGVAGYCSSRVMRTTSV